VLRSTARSRDATALMQDMRRELSATNPDADLIMQALRGQNLNDDDAAVAGLQMRLIDIADEGIDSDTGLPYEYNPRTLQQFFARRPGVVITRIVQLLTVGGGFALSVALDALFKRNQNYPDLEVQRAGELRDLVTSLGPFYIKVR
jgi:aarF domain-containing kinase